MRADYPTDLRDELLLDPEPFGQLREELRGADVPEVERMSGHDGRPDLLDDGRHLSSATAGALEGDYLPAGHLQYRPDIEAVPRSRCALPMRPLLARYSSVPTAKSMFAPPMALFTARLISPKSPPSSIQRSAS